MGNGETTQQTGNRTLKEQSGRREMRGPRKQSDDSRPPSAKGSPARAYSGLFRGNEMDESAITKRLRELRKRNNLRLEQLAERTGLTKGYLSRIENSKHPPPISTLSRIASALGVDVTELFPKTGATGQSEELAISRNNQRVQMDRRGTPYGYIYEDLALDMKGKNMEPFLVTVGFDQKIDIQTDFRHQGEEFIYVIEGKMEFYFKGESYILEHGDSVYFDANIPHSGRSVGKKRAKILIVIYSYRRG